METVIETKRIIDHLHCLPQIHAVNAVLYFKEQRGLNVTTRFKKQSEALICAFEWDEENTEEGHEYWKKVYDKLKSKGL